MEQREQPRGGHTLTRHQIGGVSVRIAVGHLDRMPLCAKCSKALCGCRDDEFKGSGK